MLRACADAGFKPRTLQVAERGHTILSLVAAGCGVALLPEPLTALCHIQTSSFRRPSNTISADLFVAFRKKSRSRHPAEIFFGALSLQK